MSAARSLAHVHELPMPGTDAEWKCRCGAVPAELVQRGKALPRAQTKGEAIALVRAFDESAEMLRDLADALKRKIQTLPPDRPRLVTQGRGTIQ